jgi:hypothetical protein
LSGENIFRFFPSVSRQLNFHYRQINSLEIVMMLSVSLHGEFGRFTLALEQTSMSTQVTFDFGEPNQYNVKTFHGLTPVYERFLPQSRTVTMRAHEGCIPLPSPTLLQVTVPLHHILHGTGMGEKIDRCCISDLRLEAVSWHNKCVYVRRRHFGAVPT